MLVLTLFAIVVKIANCLLAHMCQPAFLRQPAKILQIPDYTDIIVDRMLAIVSHGRLAAYLQKEAITSV